MNIKLRIRMKKFVQKEEHNASCMSKFMKYVPGLQFENSVNL